MEYVYLLLNCVNSLVFWGIKIGNKNKGDKGYYCEEICDYFFRVIFFVCCINLVLKGVY